MRRHAKFALLRFFGSLATGVSMQEKTISIFISYTKKDEERVVPFYEYLRDRNLDVWMDIFKLQPGHQWRYEIQRAQKKAGIVIAFLSKNSVTKRGFVQRELKDALYTLQEKLRSDIYLIPVILDSDIGIPDDIGETQAIRVSDPDCLAKIEGAIRTQMAELDEDTLHADHRSQLQWAFKRHTEAWDGLPGYKVQLKIPKLRSNEYDNLHEINDVIHAHFLSVAMDFRKIKFSQAPEEFSFGQRKQWRTSTIDVEGSDPHIKGKILSLSFAVYTDHPGAVHGYGYHRTFCFILDPLIMIKSLRDIFITPDAAFHVLQTEIRRILLLGEQETRDDLDPEQKGSGSALDGEWVDRGTENWESFENFVFTEDGITIFFPPYQVGPYAAGIHLATVKYNIIEELLHKYVRDSIGFFGSI